MTAPRIVAWELTRRCPLACRHCRAAAGAGAQEDELSPPDAQRLVRALAALPVRLLILTGGEPLLRTDVCDIARTASGRGIRVVVATCGLQLSAARAQALREAGVSAVSVSLDAPDAAGHDSFRGVPGAFEGSLQGLYNAREAGLPFQVNTTVTRHNREQLPALADLAEREGARTLDLFFLVPTGRGDALRGLQLDGRQVETTLNWVLDQRGRRGLPIKTTCAPQMARVRRQRGDDPAESARSGCMAGRGFLFISHVGRVQPCGFLDMDCGDIRAFDFDVAALMDASPVLQRLGAPSGVQGKCARCGYLQSCGGCRARALAMSGDAFAAEPFCAYDP